MCYTHGTNYLAATESICPAALEMTFEPGRQPHFGHRVVVMATPWILVASTQAVFETPVDTGKKADVSGPSGMFQETKKTALQVTLDSQILKYHIIWHTQTS